MAALVYLADPSNLESPDPGHSRILFESNGEYWYLYRYFEAANLDRRTELIDLYGGAIIDGYQLHRLRTELEDALTDIEHKPDSWKILVGWSSEEKTIDTEDWREVKRSELLATVSQLLELVYVSSRTGKKLVSSGD